MLGIGIGWCGGISLITDKIKLKLLSSFNRKFTKRNMEILIPYSRFPINPSTNLRQFSARARSNTFMFLIFLIFQNDICQKIGVSCMFEVIWFIIQIQKYGFLMVGAKAKNREIMEI